MPRAILFDHDGVLVASEPLHWAAWGELLREIGLPYHEFEIRAQVGKTGPQIISRLLDLHRPGWSADEYDLDALASRKNDHYLAVMESRLQPYPGVREGLSWLRENKIRTAVVSNAKRRELVSALEALELAPLFDAILSRDDVSPPKPDPTPYLTAAAILDAEPSECVVVEDSPPGLEAGLMAKIPTVAIASNFPREALEQPVPGRPDLRPKWIFASIREMFEQLETGGLLS